MSDFMEETNGFHVYNVYCDESCHLEHDDSSVMGFGAVAIEENSARNIAKEIRALKAKAHCRGELKWTKVSPKNTGFYCDLVDFFFSRPELSFRALIVNGKDRLDHDLYNDSSHDLFYYKMYFYLLRNIIEYDTRKELHVYIDIKDTRSASKVKELRTVLCRNFHDFEGKKVSRIQQIRSHESEPLQLADFLLGAIVYDSRELTGNVAKQAVIKRIKEYIMHGLRSTTAPWEKKFNLYHFQPRKDS